MKNTQKIILPIALALTLALILASYFPARATEFTNDGTIEAGEVINDDIFISADSVIVDGTVNGDLFVNSNTAAINGIVNGNLIITCSSAEIKGAINGSLVFAGQAILLNGPISGSIYTAGSAIRLGANAHIQRNIYFVGYHLELMEGSQVERDVRAAGAQALLNGAIGQDVFTETDALEIGGSIERNVYAEVGDPQEQPFQMYSMPFFQYPGAPQSMALGLRVSKKAQIGGKLSYSSVVEQASAIQSTPAGGVDFTVAKKTKPKQEISTNPAQALGLWIVGRIQLLATLLILGLLTVWLLPTFLPKMGSLAQATPMSALGWGVLVLIIGFVLTGLAAIAIVLTGILIGIISLGGLAQTVFGLGFSFLGLAFALFMFTIQYGSKLIFAHLGGKWILSRLSPAYAEHNAWPLALGILIYVPLNGIPVLGWLLGLAATLLGLGAIWLFYKNWRALQTI